jgi:phosphatidate cytidylyltransferase
VARDTERDEPDDEGLAHTGYRSGRVRIVGAEPAGRSASPRSSEDDLLDWSREDDELTEEAGPSWTAAPPLPHWTEPPTGEVPAVLSSSSSEEEEEARWRSVAGPSWREEGTDWDSDDDQFVPSILDEPGGGLGASSGDRQPWVFDLPGSGAEPDRYGAGDQAQAGSAEAGGALWDDEEPELEEPLFFGEDTGPSTETLPAVGRQAEPATGSHRPSPSPAAGRPIEPEPADRLIIEDFEEPPSPRRGLRGRRERAGAGAFPPAAKARRAEAPAPSGPAEPTGGRNLGAAIVSGLVLGGLALLAFKLGPAASLAVVTLVVTVAAAEAYAAFRQGGHHPVTLLGLVATVSVMVGTYEKGEAALPLVIVLLTAFCFVWFLAGVERSDPVRATVTTVFVFCWVGVFGSFGALMLNQSVFPDRRGIAFILGALVAGVSFDVGSLVFGRWLGKHPLAPSVSPNKTWEGLVGGALCAVLFSVAIVHLIHPWTVGKAAALGIVVAVVSPLGDLSESLVKRHLNLKDIGRVLPGHGGLLDRVDGLLFVLPATYYLVKAFHLG